MFIISHEATGFSIRFAHIEFDSPDDAASAYDEMNGAEVDGRKVVVDFSEERSGGGGGGFRGGRGNK